MFTARYLDTIELSKTAVLIKSHCLANELWIVLRSLETRQ